MAGVILSSYVLVALGVLVAIGGFVARRRGRPRGRYLVWVGGLLVLAGLVGLGWFVRAFG